MENRLNMYNIEIEGDQFEIVWGEDIVGNIVYKTVNQLKQYPYLDDSVFLCLANGGNWFFNNILKGFPEEPLRVEYALLSSYEGSRRSYIKKIFFPKPEKFKGKHIFIFDDIIDSGNTAAYVINKLLGVGVESINVCVLCRRETALLEPWNNPLIVDDGKWLVGCGMDYKGRGRNLGAIYGKI